MPNFWKALKSAAKGFTDASSPGEYGRAAKNVYAHIAAGVNLPGKRYC